MLDHGRIHAIGMPDDVVREMRYVLLGVTDPGFVAEEGTPRGRDRGGGDDPRIRRRRRPGAPRRSADDPDRRPDRTSRVDDLDVDFAVLDGATNHPVIEERTSSHGIVIERFDGKKRVRFRIPSFPYTAGKYWVTIGLSSRIHRSACSTYRPSGTCSR